MNQIPIEPRLTEYLHTKAARAGVPLNGTFELTPCCNMACKMCYVRMTRDQQQAIAPLKTAEEWLKLAETARENGMLYLLLTGGEPFLYPQIRELLEGLQRMGMIISINSNGTLIDEKVMEWLVKAPPMRINITLYGSSNETYARLCGNPHGYDQATHAIRLLKEAGITVRLNCSVTPYNKDDLEGIFAFAEQEDLCVQASSYMFPPVRRDESMIGHNDRFSPEEAAYQGAKISCLLNGREKYLKRMETNAPQPMAGDVGEDCPNLPDQGEGIRCRAGKCSFWITWKGDMMPCGMFPTEGAPNVFQEGFLSAWKKINQQVKEIRLPAACSVCSARDDCRACAAMAYTETGAFDRVPQYRCQMEQAYASACRKLERELRQEERK